MSRSAAANPSSFPHWVALCSLGLVLWLCFANTLPAVRERAELRALADELSQLRRQYDTAITEARLGSGAGVDYDLQGLLVAIDQHGFTPAELCAAYPLRDKQAAPPEEPDQAADAR